MKEENKFEVLIEKYRFWIGGILILAIVGGSAVLIWRENYAKPKLEDRISVLEEKINRLEADQKISNSEFLISNQNTNDQISNSQTEQGTVAGTTASSQKQATSNKGQIAGKININTATAAELDALPGIGPAYAGRIIDYRNANGGFKNIDELDNVKGIGKATIDKFRNLISVN